MLYQNFEIATVYKYPDGKRIHTIGAGTCFFILYKDNLFLVSNYHLLVGKAPLDDDGNHPIEDNPNMILITFRDKDYKKVRSVVPLLNSNGSRKFKTPDMESGFGRPLDLAIFPINKSDIPKEAIINPIIISELNINFTIPPSSVLIACGYRGDDSYTLEKPFADKVVSIDEISFSDLDKYIFAYKIMPLHGSSGGLVYYKDIPCGMVTAETENEMAFSILPELFKLKSHKLVYEFISMGEIKRQFLTLFRSKPQHSRTH